ncbi:uncharacterized protein LOC120354567 [Nilaparvata lugens]|uniref:uncharacterized protein LOC120354567 n=1 Tax=Nilaparvata lugens TaxID=108931 RepID=UPI00193E7BD5|nr:uncharacterized protein LOC120354567 [Nilaparvata lugens]
MVKIVPLAAAAAADMSAAAAAAEELVRAISAENESHKFRSLQELIPDQNYPMISASHLKTQHGDRILVKLEVDGHNKSYILPERYFKEKMFNLDEKDNKIDMTGYSMSVQPYGRTFNIKVNQSECTSTQ